MKTDNLKTIRADRVWLRADASDIEEFKALIERKTDPADYP
jgi:hypothetical protein